MIGWNQADELVGGALNDRDREWWLVRRREEEVGVMWRREWWLGEEELQKESTLIQPKSRLSMRVCCSYMYT